MKNWLWVILMLGWCGVANASQFFIQWEAPTTREDGSPLNNAEIIRYDIRVKTPGSDDYQDLSPVISDPDIDRYNTNYTLENIAGEYCFQLQTLDRNDFTSKWTDPICLSYVPVVAPSMPGNIVIEIRIKP